MPKVLVTTPTFAKYDSTAVEYLTGHGFEVARLSAYPANPTEIGVRLADCDAAIVGLEKFDANVLAGAPRLRIISKHGIGVDNIDLAAAKRAGIMVANAPYESARTVAELALLLLLASARRLLVADEAVRTGKWGPLFGTEVKGKTLGLVGIGSIGVILGEIAAALGMRVIGYDVAYSGSESIKGVTLVGFDECLEQSDFLSLHVPLTDKTRGLIDEATLRRMKKTAVLINTSRGEVVDEQALYKALKEGWISGAGLDVFQSEPVKPDNPLTGLENVVLTPHMGGYSYEAISRTSLVAAQNVVAAIETGNPLYPVY
ncbi:MAG: phosphoglycerate dehydrogenase [Firmicutes bacterium]|nr:phosphoglycerate dehydrogenase [Bacillota bacterium]